MRTRTVVGLLAAFVALGACGNDGGSSDAAPPPVETADDPGTRPISDDPTLDAAAPATGLLAVEAQTVDGSTLDLAAYAGSDLVIWFWAPW